MSQSPTDSQSKGQIEKYRAGWTALNTLLSQGGSLSGRERNCVFMSCGSDAEMDPKFANVSALSGFDFSDDARGIALTDWDHDGDVDLWVNNRTAPRLRLMKNQTPASSGFVAFKLIGTRSNRDAIGARVAVEVGGAPVLVRSVQAGGGYLSQSSKWLHFGFPADAVLKSVTVIWPGGEDESFSGVAAGAQWILKEGKGKASSWRRQGGTPNLVASVPKLPAPTAQAAVVLPRRIPAPQLEYVTAAGGVAPVEPGSGALLLLFYAHWCPNCHAELKSITANAAQLRAAGLDVLALSVDPEPSAREAADRKLAAIGFPFASGHATETTIAKLKHLENMLFELQIAPVVPFGFMLDARGDFYATYRGQVTVDLLASDAALASASQQQIRDASVPFPGRWYTLHPGEVSILELLADHYQEPYPAEAVRYLDRALPQLPVSRAGRVKQRLAGLQYQIGSKDLAEGRSSAAERCFRAAVAHKPDYAAAQHDLGAALFRLGNLEEAALHFEKTLDLLPGNARAQANLDLVRKEIETRGG
ncbi:MAG: peroxiredoxin [Verrucomicrobiales bacterium]